MALRATIHIPLLASLLLQAAAASGQTVGTTGSVSGKVTDRSGAVLPDVAITVSGDGLIRPRTTSTGPDGLYRFPAIPAGWYSLVFEHQGFGTVQREDVRVGIGSSTTVDAMLPLAAMSDHVIVERGAPIIDRRSTAIVRTLDARQLESLPTSRSLFAMLSVTPAIRVTRFEVGGSSGDAGSPYGAYGIVGLNVPLVEGIITSQIFPTGVPLDYGAFEEAAVGVAAHNAEWPLPGVQMQIVTKSGGNRYRGTVYVDYEHRHWQSHCWPRGETAFRPKPVPSRSGRRR